MIEESSECHLGWVFCNPDETENYIIPPMCIGTGEEGYMIEPTITKKISNICGFSFK